MQNVLDILSERGFIQQISEPEELAALLSRQPITLYWGYDATARSLHIGSLVSIMMLAWFQRCGHRPIALAGGGTTLIGDPTGRTTSRPMLSEGEIEQNLQAIQGQLANFLDFRDGRALALNNATWLKPLSFVDFMRDIGSRFSVNEVLRLEAYRTRLEAGGLSFLELSYVLMQSYDFLHLYKEYDSVLQIGGSDQWGNSISGADLIRRVTGGQAYVLVTPLIETSEGAKMGKSAGGAVWLDAQMTSPYEYYQYWRNVPDTAVERCLAIFTFLPMEEVRSLGELQGAELNRAKDVLAYEATALLHGKAEADNARAASLALFTHRSAEEHVPGIEIERARFVGGMPVTELFREAGLVASANEARRQIEARGLYLNGDPVTDPRMRVDLSAVGDGELLLRFGKKKYVRVVVK